MVIIIVPSESSELSVRDERQYPRFNLLSSLRSVPHYHIFPFINLLGLSKDFHSPILAVTIVTQQINS